MAITDTNSVIRAYLATCTTLTALVGSRIYWPRLPENVPIAVQLPAVSFFTRGGTSTPYIPGIPSPSVQFDCWADNPITARQVYRALYDNLQGIQNVNIGSVVVIGTDGLDYSCILAHTAEPADKPITGANWATYWVATGSSGIGSAWIFGTLYPLTYQIMSAIEEVQGMDLVDSEIQGYFRVLTFFEVMVRAE